MRIMGIQSVESDAACYLCGRYRAKKRIRIADDYATIEVTVCDTCAAMGADQIDAAMHVRAANAQAMPESDSCSFLSRWWPI